MDRDNLVRVRLRISMKLEIVCLISALYVMVGLVQVTNASCIVRNVTLQEPRYMYQCFRSDNDYNNDLGRAPVDVSMLTFTRSNIPVIRNRSFDRLRKSLEVLWYHRCGVEDIEEDAFRGLTKLMTLAFIDNKLHVIKSAWFEGLSSLREVIFRNNKIRHVQENFFSGLPPLEKLDISGNQLTCLPTFSVGNFKTQEFNFGHNHLTLMCHVLVMDWLKDTTITGDFLEPGGVDPTYELASICASNAPRFQLNEEFLKKCVDETKQAFLPSRKNYTVKQVCEFLKARPSHFLNCNK